MGSRRTLFSKQWLDNIIHPEFANWIGEVDCDHTKAYCKVCMKSFSLSNMGITALNSHASGPLHKKYQNAKLSQRSISAVFLKPKPTDGTQDSSTDKTTTQDRSTKANDNAVKEKTQSGDLSTFILKDDVLKAECLWALEVVEKRLSFNCYEDISNLLRRMFPDSVVADKFKLGSTKVAYMISFGLAPYFRDNLMQRLKECTEYVICFDEALNKIVQKGQMDQVVRFWDATRNRVATRYLNSVFLLSSKADDLLEKFLEGMSPLLLARLLQVFMDGPNVNLSFWGKLEETFQSNADVYGNCRKDLTLLDLGTCGLHIVHGSIKTGLDHVKWDLNSVLRHMYYLFKDSPARRSEFMNCTGTSIFPLKFCATRWVENGKCAERAIQIFDSVKKYVTSSKLPNSKPAQIVRTAVQDPMMVFKLAFLKTVTDDLEPFLRRFQSSKPLAPFLYEELHDLIRKLMERVVKPEVVNKATSAHQLMVLDLSTENLLDRNKVDIGFAARKLLKGTKGSERDVAEFLFSCRKLLVRIIEKLVEKCPLKYKIVGGLSALDPAIILHKSTVGKCRMDIALEIIHQSGRITDKEAENAKKQYAKLCKDAGKSHEIKKKFEAFLSQSNDTTGLDEFFSDILAENANKNYQDLWKVVKLCLILSHGNASVESGFSINKFMLIEIYWRKR